MDQDALYAQVAAEFGQPLARLAAAYERNPSRRQDLQQELHFSIWRSLAGFRNQCSLRTWVYRVAHNTAATWIRKEQRDRRLDGASLEDLEGLPDSVDVVDAAHETGVWARVHALLHGLKPIDRDVLLLYLEGLKAVEISEVVGISAGYVAQKVHRAQKFLQQQFSGERHDLHR
jgi:RNA polymerase sigma-70 factor (ECF subfamily)